MTVTVRNSGDIQILDLIGTLDTATSAGAESEITKVLEAGNIKIIINLAKTEYVSSSGLRVLLITAKKLSALAGTLKICEPNDVVREILDISGFSTFLDVRSSVDEALAEMLL